MRWTESMGALLSLRIAVRKRGRVLLLVALAAVPLAGCGWLFQVQRAALFIRLEPPFLSEGNFDGSFTPRAGNATDGLQSTYAGTAWVTSVDRGTVQQMLPPGFRLAPVKMATWGGSRHPVVMMIGRQGAPSSFVGSFTFQLGPGYDEMILFVPFVVRGADTRWHNYVVRMYLNHWIPVFGGEAFGYAKVLARLDRSQAGAGAATHHTGSTEDLATTWFEADIDPPTPNPAPPSNTAVPPLPRWNDVRRILEMPFLGIRPDTLEACSYWEMDFANATVERTAVRHRVVTSFRQGMEAWPNFGTLHSADNGAFSMSNVRWRLATLPILAQGC